MTQHDLLDLIAADANLPRAATLRAYRALTYYITAHIRRAWYYTWRGWGTYYRSPQNRTEFRNPRTGAHAHSQGTLAIRFHPSDYTLTQVQP